jgi:18S rRNA (adenine1779-N6/adenine1780-N6)-dimethyltransferase
MDLLERNYRTLCAQNDIVLDDGLVEAGADEMDVEEQQQEQQQEQWDGIMDMDDEDDLPDFFKEEQEHQAEEAKARERNRKKKGKVSELVRAKVKRVLENTGLAGTRARMCDQNDFLKLLEGFNEEGIHFA